MIVTKGGNKNAMTTGGWTPLMMAAAFNRLEVAAFLLSDTTAMKPHRPVLSELPDDLRHMRFHARQTSTEDSLALSAAVQAAGYRAAKR